MEVDSSVEVDASAAKKPSSDVASPIVTQEEKLEFAGFAVPLWKQRLRHCISVLCGSDAKSVVDLGSAEGKLLLQLREKQRFTRLVGVDIVKGCLFAAAARLEPLHCDYFFQRGSPLTVELYHGSICEPDQRLCNIDAAACIEVIEHLPIDDVPRFTAATLGVMRPRLLVVTTPNSEFNPFFPLAPGVFRHDDHKFEWTRAEFQQWGNTAAERHGYAVEYGGIGDSPPGCPDVGGCSQFAIFRLRSDTPPCDVASVAEPYDLVRTHVYPFVTPGERHETIVREAVYWYNKVAARDKKPIELTELMAFSSLTNLCSSAAELAEELLQSEKLQLNEQRTHVVWCNEWPQRAPRQAVTQEEIALRNREVDQRNQEVLAGWATAATAAVEPEVVSGGWGSAVPVTESVTLPTSGWGATE
eukprot:TRINITY_DN1111_c0_g1_i1.p1 TRINITY_DN1111_c0_g1~~TRINITY_DN1111_c0_g1_i1.p1  ORF type:complete len:415 (-),score=86.32 TRINITY_DN1111_c0_g1_i1:1945-3189(-)